MVQNSMNVNHKNKEHRIRISMKGLLHNPWFERVADEIKASGKSEDTDDPVDVIVYNPISIRLAHLFIRWGWSANAVTCLSFLFGVSGSVFFYPQNRWLNLLGICFEVIALILDFCDGQIARLTHTSSQLGRVLDGTVDITNFLAVYIAIGCRMMNETIPFTDEIPWSFYIWPLLIVTMLCHASQARMADYYRGLHLFFLNGRNSSNMTRAKILKSELAAQKGSPLYERVYRFFYLIYTSDQEKYTPRAQRLLNALEEKGGTVSDELAEAYITQSRRYIQLTNTLTYHIRACTLFVLLMLRLHAFYFPLVIIVLEVVKWFMIARYEKIAKNVYERFCL
ncbi:MAG: CDP-alcohol phosphatidyltransferase family protein [Lachnospiraceae bacterium]|nr:CDP-alcohol phosphatidyltransferase family protein [Lachnospiraceae bacterium]